MAKKPTKKELEQKIRETEKVSVGQKSLENALRESQECLKLAVDGADLGMWDWKVQTGEVHFSERWAEILGYSHNEIKPHVSAWEDLLHPEDVPSVMETLEANLEGRDSFYECEHRLRTKSGEWRWVLARGKVIERDEDGKPLRHAGTHMDINERMETQRKLKDAFDELEQRVEERTAKLKRMNEKLKQEIKERKQAEESIIQAKEDWERTFNALPELISIIDESFKIVRVNKAMADRLSMTPDKMMGLNCYEEIHGTEEPPPFCPHVKLLADGHEHTAEVHEERLNGDFFVTVSPIYGTDDHVAGCVHVAHDITERIQAEEEKAKLETQLQQAQKMEAIGALAGGVAHDLNNVLSGIVSYPDLLLMQLPKDSPLIEPIRVIQATGKKAAAIVQDLLTLARRGVVVSDVVNLNTIIEEYLTSPEYEKLKSFHPGILVEANLETDLLNTLGSPIHLSQSVMNLISNAAEAMPEGGKLFISTRNQYIDKSINGYDHIEEGDYAVLMISDTGAGISSEDLGRIFEPFYTKKTMGRSGTGLGMAVVWGTVKDHKGYIEVQSAVGEGTTFTIYFPITRQKQEEDEREISTETYRGSGETILIIDDIEEQREIASSILSELNYSVSTVSSGEEAVEYLKNDSVDLLLLDMIMEPGMDGLETYKKILQLHPGQKAIIASGFTETDRIKEAQRLGAGEYIGKPYTLEKIAITVKNEIDKR